MTIKVFLLDDHEVVRLGLRQLLDGEPDLEVVGEAASATEAITHIQALRPDVAVLDVRLPDGDGIGVCREIRSAMDAPPACLMLTSFSDDEALFTAIMAGAAGYLLKQVSGMDLVSAVRRLAAGESLLDPALTTAVLDRLRRPAEQDESPVPVADRAGAEDPRPDRGGQDQPADRRETVPGREDGEELRLRVAPQTRHGPPDRGGRLRGRTRAAPAVAVRVPRSWTSVPQRG